MDRALKKFLSFPVFDQPFVEAICDVGLSRSEFWMVLDFDEDSGSRVFDMIPALPGSGKSKALLASRHDHIMILFDMVQKGKKTVFNNFFTDLGFGAGSSVVEPKVKPPGAVVKEVSDQSAVKRPNPYGSSTTWVSLKAQEDTEKSKPGCRRSRRRPEQRPRSTARLVTVFQPKRMKRSRP